MELFNKISEDELYMIQHQINNYAQEEYNEYDAAPLSYILREWDAAKSLYLSRMFGDDLILSKSIEVSKSKERIWESLNDLMWEYPLDVKMVRVYENKYLDSDFITNTNIIYNLFSRDNLITNTYLGDTVEIPIPNGTFKIRHGARLMKTVIKLIKVLNLDIDLEGFYHFQRAYSKILTQTTIKGELCLSIHPLDYITMSDNASNWNSCMSWENNGCYRQGTVEMMNSPCVVVAYLRDKDDMSIGHCEWSNKTWRELYIVNHEIITNIKSYPYDNEEITKIVIEWLRDLATEANIGQYSDEIRKHKDSYFIDNDISFSFLTDIMYNDFGHNGPHCVISKTITDNYTICVMYSGKSECMVCGALDPDFYDDATQDLVCRNCNTTLTVCEYCGNRINVEEDSYYTDVDGNIICDDCRWNVYAEDAFSGELFHIDNLIRVGVCDDEQKTPISNEYIFVNPNNSRIGTLSVDSDIIPEQQLKKHKSVFYYSCDYFIPISKTTDVFRKYYNYYCEDDLFANTNLPS